MKLSATAFYSTRFSVSKEVRSSHAERQGRCHAENEKQPNVFRSESTFTVCGLESAIYIPKGRRQEYRCLLPRRWDIPLVS